MDEELVKRTRYVLQRNHCNCHPETCCCDPYKVVDIITNTKLSTHYNWDDGKRLVDTLNNPVR